MMEHCRTNSSVYNPVLKSAEIQLNQSPDKPDLPPIATSTSQKAKESKKKPKRIILGKSASSDKPPELQRPTKRKLEFSSENKEPFICDGHKFLPPLSTVKLTQLISTTV